MQDGRLQCNNSAEYSSQNRRHLHALPSGARTKKQQAYIEQHRKTVNLFEGLTDHLDILKVMHAPRRQGPLIQYTPYPLSMEQLYISLADNEAGAMLEYAMELLAINNESEAEDILLSLVCYRNDNISNALPELIERGLFHNPIVLKMHHKKFKSSFWSG